MKGGLDRLIARVAQGRQDVRPLAPTMFEEDGAAGDWVGEQAGERLAEVREAGQPSTAAMPLAPQRVPTDPAREPDLPGKAAPRPSEPIPPPQANPIERRPQLRDLTPRSEHRATMDPSSADELSARLRPAELKMRPSLSPAASSPSPASPSPASPPQQQALVETVENNSIVVEIGRIEVKAPPIASPSSPPPPQRRPARLSLDTYLSERRAAKR
jgi:hypothetical protein